MFKKMNQLINQFSGYKNAVNSSSSVSLQVFSRSVVFNLPSEEKFVGNRISTAKYNFFTFLPLFLFEQFRKAFNVFFLFISIIQQIPNVSPTGRYTTLVPLLAILTVAAIKEIIEDYKRHRQDDAVNNRLVDVFRNGKFIQVRWTKVSVGDVVRVYKDKFFPADLVLLSSSEPQAMCYIETANLDGETNLKIRQGLSLTKYLQSSEDLTCICGRITCESPNRHLYEFNGKIFVREEDSCVPLCNDQMLLRGAVLRNTQWIYGVVVYTGHETKLMKNANKAPLKLSNVDRTTNMQIWFIFLILITISIGSAVGGEIWKKSSTGMWYISDNGPGARGFFLELLTFIILYNNLVPISLLVTLEMVKFIQAIFINCDLDMYYEPTDTPAMARTSNLNEELGQVKFIFSDKTGTLTRNEMVFRKCSVAGVQYGKNNDDHKGFYDEEFTEKLKNGDVQNQALRDFATIMAVCHTVVPHRLDDPENGCDYANLEDHSNALNIEYQSSSPDETALVEAAKSFGYCFTERTPTHMTINRLGEDETYEVLNVLEFTSTRKRMSVIVRAPNNSIFLFCKGADNVIYERLTEDSQFLLETENHLKEFASEGLRTLCLAYTKLDEDTYKEWNSTVYYSASTAIHGRDDAVSAAYEQVEKNLYLVGATAIEDRLQDDVPESVATLLSAGIKLWVLTGDKQETAVNIAHSCRLFTDKMNLIFLDQTTIDETRESINAALNDIGTDSIRHENDVALVINGAALKLAISYDLRDSFLDLVLSCKSVVCCRVSPIQKAEVVEMIKVHCKAITLAIGDGANDVSMIQAAHVGVGISGREGLQAANASDYSIAQFAYLRKLLLVHGSWNYTRLTKCILFSFYKNICLYLIQLWFAFFNGFSGQILFDRWTIALYNVLFTSLPPIALGLFERPCSVEYMLKYPKLYSITQGAIKYNALVFWKMFLNSTLHSLMLFFLTSLAVGNGVAFIDGKTGGYLFLGNFVYSFVVVTVCLKAGLESTTWTWLTHFSIWGSIIIWFVFFIVYSYVFPGLDIGAGMVRMASNVLSSPIFWFSLIFIPITVLFKDLLWKVIRRKFMKSVIEEVQELESEHIDPSPTINAAAIRQSLSEKALLLKNSFGIGKRRSESLSLPLTMRDTRNRTESQLSSRGYAFSIEEDGVVTQAQLIRHYNTKQPKPDGN